MRSWIYLRTVKAPRNRFLLRTELTPGPYYQGAPPQDYFTRLRRYQLPGVPWLSGLPVVTQPRKPVLYTLNTERERAEAGRALINLGALVDVQTQRGSVREVGDRDRGL